MHSRLRDVSHGTPSFGRGMNIDMTMLEPAGSPSRERRLDWTSWQHDDAGPAGDLQQEEPKDHGPKIKKNEKRMQASTGQPAATSLSPSRPSSRRCGHPGRQPLSHLISHPSQRAVTNPVCTHPSEPNPTTRRPEGRPRPLLKGCSKRPVATKEDKWMSRTLLVRHRGSPFWDCP